jgi:hypothetical protein
MKISEVIVEGREGKKPESTHGDTGEWRFRDKGGYDRTYNLNRVMMATAMADGKSNKPLYMDQASWVDRYNTARPYTEEEHNMMKQAFATVDSEYEQTEADHKSREPKDTHKTSPHRNPGPITRRK